VVLAPSPGTPAYVNASLPAVVSETPAAQRVPAPAAAVTPPDASTDLRVNVPDAEPPTVLTTQTPHGSAYIATDSAVRTPLDAGVSTPAPAAQRPAPPTRTRLRR
jgi:hypothetical protein